MAYADVSNRAGISRVTNDSWQVLTLLLMMHCLVRRKFVVASVLLSIAVSLKMNAIFYVPSLVFIIWHVATIRRCVWLCAVMRETTEWFHVCAPLH